MTIVSSAFGVTMCAVSPGFVLTSLVVTPFMPSLKPRKPFAQTLAELRQLLAAKQHQHHDGQNDQMRRCKIVHPYCISLLAASATHF